MIDCTGRKFYGELKGLGLYAQKVCESTKVMINSKVMKNLDVITTLKCEGIKSNPSRVNLEVSLMKQKESAVSACVTQL